MLAVATGETFLLIDGLTHSILLKKGTDIDTRVSPCSTFKMALSLMGYDRGVLIDRENPTWSFQNGYDDWLTVWRNAQTPLSWMQYSSVWYSKVLSMKLGLESIQRYVTEMSYGNQDMSGGLVEAEDPEDPVWINSSLQISPREQVEWIDKMLTGMLPVSPYAIEMTKNLLFKEDLSEEWKLFGKTGWSGRNRCDTRLEHGWFVGWVEKNQHYFPFAYLMRVENIPLDQMISRVKELLNESGLLNGIFA